MRASTRRCRSLAAWYSAFSRRSPSSRARLISLWQLGLQLAVELMNLVLEFLQDSVFHVGHGSRNGMLNNRRRWSGSPVARTRSSGVSGNWRGRRARRRPARFCSTAPTCCRRRWRPASRSKSRPFPNDTWPSAQSPLAQLAEDLGRRGGRTIGVTDQVLAAMSPVEHPSGVVAIAHAQPSGLDAAFSPGSDAAALTPLVLVLAGIAGSG